MAIFVPIWNLDDSGGTPHLWTATGSDAKPQITWTASDPESAISAYRVALYDTQAHALAYPSATGRLYDSGKTTGNPGFVNANYGMKNRDQAGAEVWLVVQVFDDLDESTTLTPTGIKVCWGQAVYESNPGSSSSGWTWDAAATVAGTQLAFLFRSASTVHGGGTVSAWATSLSLVPANTYFDVCVRLATYTVGTSPSLANMTISYSASAQVPDKWTASNSDWTLDTATYRYGTRGFKCAVSSNSGDRTIFPFRVTSGDDIPVTPRTDYVWSIYVKTSAPLHSGSKVVLEIWDSGGTRKLADGTATDVFDTNGLGVTSDTSGYNAGEIPPAIGNSQAVSPDGWQRIHVHYRTEPGMTKVRPLVRYVQGGAGSGDIFWVDAAMLSEGFVVPSWEPGFLSPAVVIDSYGVTIDQTGGGDLKLKNAAGDTAAISDVVTAAAHVHRGSGSPEAVVTAPVGDLYMRTDGGATTSLYVKTSGSGNTGWTAK